MRNRAVWAAVALSAVIVAISSTNANAFCCHKYRSVPIWFGAYYPNCGVCGPCIVPYNISGSIGGCGGGYGAGCGYGASCGYGYGSGAGCVKKQHQCGLFARKARKHAMAGYGSSFGCGYGYSACGDGCDGGCGGSYGGCDGGCSGGCDGGCSGGCDGGCSGSGAGCSNCGGGDGGGGGSEEVLYDGPAADAPATSDPSASMIRRPLVLLAGLHQGRETNREDGSAAFARGVSAYRQGTLGDASRDFEAAAAAEPGNALYLYYRALAQFEQLGADSAADALQQAVEAEKQGPISGWGKQMERVQGRGRVWIEKARREAGLVR